MSYCERLPDRMPEVAGGRSNWTDEEQRHLVSCAECAAEWRIVSAAQRLGEDVAATVEPKVVAETVLGRLAAATHRDRQRVRWGSAGLALAAAATLVLMLWTDRPTPSSRDAGDDEFVIQLPVLDSLTSAQLEMVLESLDAPLSGSTSIDAPTMGELDDQQLERILRSLEG